MRVNFFFNHSLGVFTIVNCHIIVHTQPNARTVNAMSLTRKRKGKHRMIYSKAVLLRFLGKGLEQLLCSRALFFGEVKPSQCISRSPGLMVRTVHHLAVKWDLGVSMWEKKKKQNTTV